MARIQDVDLPYLEFAEAAAPGTPAAGIVRIYAKTDNKLYQKDDAGVETDLAAAGGSLTDHTHAATGSGATGGGATLNPTSLNANGLFRLGASIDSAVDADQNDFNPGSLHAIGVIRFTSFTANRTVTGINAGSQGEALILHNNTSFSLLLPNESASSSASNRIRSPNAATHTVRQGGSALLVYLSGRWAVIAA